MLLRREPLNAQDCEESSTLPHLEGEQEGEEGRLLLHGYGWGRADFPLDAGAQDMDDLAPAL